MKIEDESKTVKTNENNVAERRNDDAKRKPEVESLKNRKESIFNEGCWSFIH